MDWANVFISNKSLTFEDIVYRANDEKEKRASKSYYWNDHMPVEKLGINSDVKEYQKCNVLSLK